MEVIKTEAPWKYLPWSKPVFLFLTIQACSNKKIIVKDEFSRQWYSNSDCSVSWGCRIRQLHFCRGVRSHPPTNRATYWPWVVTRKALGWDPSGCAVIDLAAEWSMTCNTLLWPLLGLMGIRMGLIQSILDVSFIL